MAHFASLDDNNIVTQVIVVANAAIDDLPFPDSEPIGIAFCQSLYGENTKWKQTSYNANFRKNYVGVGGSYDETLDAFIPEKVYPSWVLNPETCLWEAPISYPTDGKNYSWDETTQSWVEIENNDC